MKTACQSRRRRRGITAIEATISLNVFFVTAALMYFLAVRAFAGLYEIISIHGGSPYN